MIKKINYKPLALQDLQEIWAYIANDNLQKADEFVDLIKAKIKFLGAFSGAGISKNYISKNLRLFTFRDYNIWYFEEKKQIRISRVVHGSRDLKKLNF